MQFHKRHTTRLHALTLVAVSAVFFVTALAGMYKCFSREPELNGGEVQAPVDNTTSQEDEGVLPGGDTAGRRKQFYTILIGGLDNENGGSDTNLLVALDAANGRINVLSLPRDTLLNVSWSVKKLNNAYHHGGFSRTMEEVSNLLGIPVDFYITVDLNAFVELVDTIGGVKFDVPLDMNYDDPYQDLHIHISKGLQLLGGEDALKVVRWRQNNDGSGYATADIGRIGTQQAFLSAMARQTLQLSNWDNIPEMAKIFRRNVDTDLELANLIWIGEQALSMGSSAISFYTLPGDGAGFYKGISYYAVDPAATVDLINASFNPYTHSLTVEDMDILVP